MITYITVSEPISISRLNDKFRNELFYIRKNDLLQCVETIGFVRANMRNYVSSVDTPNHCIILKMQKLISW